MILKSKGGTYERQICDVCKREEPQDYLILADRGNGNIVYIHPIAEGRCKPGETIAAKLAGTLLLLALGAYFAAAVLGN